MVIRATRVVVFAATLAALTSCDGGKSKASKDLRSSEDEGGKAQEATTDSGDPDGGETEALALGLPKFCSFTAENGCFRCTPRELPLEKCAADLSASFDPAKDCKHDDATLSCGDFTFAFGEKSRLETLYEQIPQLVGVAKLLLAQQLADKQDVFELVSQGLDLITKHRLSIFTGENVNAPAQDLVKLIKQAKPDIAEDKLKEVETKVAGAITAVVEKRRSRSLSEDDLLLLLLSFVSQIPGVQELFSGALDIESLLGALTNTQDPEAAKKLLEGLSSILGNFGGKLGGEKDEKGEKDDDQDDEGDDEGETDD